MEKAVPQAKELEYLQSHTSECLERLCSGMSCMGWIWVMGYGDVYGIWVWVEYGYGYEYG